MIRLYEEHEEFDRFTRFDTTVGRLTSISEIEFKRYLPDGYTPDLAYLRHMLGKEQTHIFTGARPSTHVRFPRRIYMQITHHCNLTCPYCYIHAAPGQPHVPTNAVFEIADFMGDQGLMEVRLSGGEPTRHPDFLDIMHRFKSNGVYVSVGTNGVWSPRIRDALCEEPNLWVICSVDGGKELHNRYRPHTFDHIISNLMTLRARNPSARVRLTAVLTRANKGQMMELGEICQMVGAESITVIPLRPQVRDPKIRDEMVDCLEFKRVIEDLLLAQDRYGVQFTTTIETDYKDRIYPDPVTRERSACAAGREATNLDYDASTGEFVVYACSYSPASDISAPAKLRQPFVAGRFKAGHPGYFLDVWRDSEAWRIYRDLSIRSEDCKGCRYLTNHQCTGACPVQNINFKAIDVAEAFCGAAELNAITVCDRNEII